MNGMSRHVLLSRPCLRVPPVVSVSCAISNFFRDRIALFREVPEKCYRWSADASVGERPAASSKAETGLTAPHTRHHRGASRRGIPHPLAMEGCAEASGDDCPEKRPHRDSGAGVTSSTPAASNHVRHARRPLRSDSRPWGPAGRFCKRGLGADPEAGGIEAMRSWTARGFLKAAARALSIAVSRFSIKPGCHQPVVAVIPPRSRGQTRRFGHWFRRGRGVRGRADRADA